MNRLIAVALIVFASTAAFAQASRTWVATSGSDASNCAISTPCLTFSGALAKTAIGGVISCLDSGDFGGGQSTTIAQSITIDCADRSATAIVSNDNGFNVTTAAASIVTLRGLSVIGLNSSGLIGINVVGAAAVVLDRIVISGFHSGSGLGVNFAPPAGGVGKLFVRDGMISDNGKGIWVKPNTGGANALIERTSIVNNGIGVHADGGGSTGGVNVAVVDCKIFGNSGHAIYASGGASLVVLRVDGCSIFANGGSALRAENFNVYIIASRTMANRNSGVGFDAQPGSNILTYGTNMVVGNLGGDGGATGGIGSN